jgi:hypothetical protein
VGIRNCKKPRWFLRFTMAVLKKNSRMGLEDTTSVHICSINNNIKNAHGSRIKKPRGKKLCSKSACQALKLENKDFWLTTVHHLAL